MFYGDVFKTLNKSRVKYVVAGGVAVVLHGYQRLTNDLDLIVFLEENNLEKLFESLGTVGYIPKVPVTKDQFKDKSQRDRWQKEKGMIVFSFVQRKPPFNLVDIFVQYPLDFDSLYKNRINVKVDNVVIPIASIDHLIKIKQKAGRNIDLNDIEQLKKIKQIRGRIKNVKKEKKV